MNFEKFKIWHLRFNSDSVETWNKREYTEYINAMHENIKFHEWALKDKSSKYNFALDSFCCLTMADNVFDSLDEKGEIKHDDHDVVINK